MFLRGLWDVSLNGDLIEISQRHLMPAMSEFRNIIAMQILLTMLQFHEMFT